MKTPEKQLADLFHKFSVERFDHTEFARLIAQDDNATQQTFFYAMRAFIAYKAGFAENFIGELSPDSLAMWCLEMDNFRIERERDVVFKNATYNEAI